MGMNELFWEYLEGLQHSKVDPRTNLTLIIVEVIQKKIKQIWAGYSTCVKDNHCIMRSTK